jgi:hypothetical protein
MAMGSAPSVGQYYFDGWDLPTKYGWMHHGPGVAAANTTQDAVREMAQRLIDSGERVRGLLGGSEWAGAAAVAAGQAMQRAAEQITQSAEGAATADHCVSELGECFAAAQRRVPSPNEVPTDLGDRFLYGAAEGFNAISPFDVQSPLHEAMQQRRELDQQANLALTDHMTTSRDRVEAMPAVAAPAPMTVTTQSAHPAAGGVGQASGAAPMVYSPSGTPSATPTAGWSGGPPPVSVGGGAGPGADGIPVSTGPTPDRTDLAGAATERSTGMNRSAATGVPPLIGPITGGVAADEQVSGRAGGRGAGFGGRAAIGEGGSGRGVWASGGTPSARGGAVEGTAGRSTAGIGGGRSAANSFLQPPIGGRGTGGDDDTEHTDRYAQQTDHIIGELPLVAPAVLGETPEEEAQRLQDGR